MSGICKIKRFYVLKLQKPNIKTPKGGLTVAYAILKQALKQRREPVFKSFLARNELIALPFA